MLADMGTQFLDVDGAMGFHHGAHRLAPFLVGKAEHQRIIDGRMGLQRFLNLFGKHLLAAGVDALAAAAEQGEAAISLDDGEIARDGIALAVDFREGGRRLDRILPVSARDEAAAGDAAHRAGRDRLHVVTDDQRVAISHELGGRAGIVLRLGSRPQPQAFRRPQTVDDHQIGCVRQQAGLHFG